MELWTDNTKFFVPKLVDVDALEAQIVALMLERGKMAMRLAEKDRQIMALQAKISEGSKQI